MEQTLGKRPPKASDERAGGSVRAGHGSRQGTPRRIQLQHLGAPITLGLLVALFTALSPKFLSVPNAEAMLESAAIPIVLVVGMTFLIVQGSIDLSIEGVMAASSMAASLLVGNSITPHDWGIWGILAGVAFGMTFGLANGLIYAFVRLPSLIVTLATWFISLGTATLLFPGRQPQILDHTLTSLALDKRFGVSALVLLAIAVAVAGRAVQGHTQFGRLCYAIGADEQMTRHSGLPVTLHKVAAFTLMGLLSGLGGVMISAQLGVGNPTAGQGFLFPTISGAVIGGTLLSGGRGGVLSSVVGVLILEVLRNGMVQVGIDPYLQHVVEGAIIIAALVLGNWSLRTRMRVVK